MRKVTQKELLSEGFWGKVGRGVKAAGVLTKDLADTFVPEISNPIRKTWNRGKEVYKNVDNALTPLRTRLFRNLMSQGYYLLSRENDIRGIANHQDDAKHYVVRVSVLDYDDNGKPLPTFQYDNSGAIAKHNGVPIIKHIKIVVDENGRILRDLSKAAAPLSKAVRPTRTAHATKKP